MIEDFHCITMSGGMFSAEFLIKIADGDTTVEGTNPSTYWHENSHDLNNYISSLWSAACHTWKTLGQKAVENGEVATYSKSFIKRLLQSMEIDVGTTICPTSGDRPQIWRQALGSVWHVIAAGAPLDDRSEAVGAKRISPHSLVQGHLNSENKHQWGVVSNGVQFRILRSNNRPSVTESIEFDLQKMFSEGHFGDFKMFFMLIHASRWPSNAPEDSPAWLDSWYKASGEQGMSVLADLQSCVKKAAECFGSGFVRLSAGNIEFRQALRDQPGLADEMQRQLMRFIYQLIFIFVTEERDILLIKSHEQMSEEQVNTVEQARLRYETSYSTKRRRSTLHRQRMDNHFDGYEEIKVILSALRGGCDGLALPALGSFLFSENSTPLLDPLRMLNRDYIAGLNKLCKFMRDGQSHRVHWKTLRETELGSVYESLLELRPIIDMEQGTFVLQNIEGNDRQSSGSHYTPRVLVNHLIATTVEPLLKEAKSGVVRKYRGTDATPDFIKAEKIEAILSLTVCDPASGSGHFLLAALERFAVELAKIDSEEVYPAPSLIQRWKRDVASRCIYGVDLNPTAVELCKVAIWMDTYDGSRPLSFLDSHIRHGNSLLGQDTSYIGLIPDKAIANDWRVTSQEHKKFNRRERARVAKEIDSKLQKLEKALKRTYGARHDGITLNVQLEEGGKSKSQILSEIRQLKSDREFILEKIPLGQSKLGNIIDLKSVIQSIALSQTEMNDMTESTLEELEDKSEAFNSLLSLPHKLWIKEVLDASIAMWWWPNQDSHEATIPLPLSSLDLDSYATWLAHEHDIQDDVLSTKFGRNSSTSTIQRYEQIRSWTKNIASSNSFFHWEIEFPEIFAGNEPGFSLTLGNPPFLGGAKISTAAGVETANFIRDKFQGKAKTDLIAYFFLNAHNRMSSKGRMGMVTTNSAGQGDTRHTGLRRIVSSGSTICNAETDIIWPGTAAVTVDLITISKSKVKDISFNGADVNFISSRLDLRPEFDPVTLTQNTDKSQRGVNPRGPFQLDEEKAKQFLSLNTTYSEVIKPFLDGRDLTNTGVPSRYIIDFGSKSLSEAQEYSHVFQHVKDLVYPYRMGLKDKKEYVSLKEKWWQYEFTAQSIQKWFVNHNTAYAKGRVASNWIFTKISSGYVCGEATFIFFFEETDKFAVLQSSLHEHWCKVFTSTLGSSGLRYTNVCINPFPFPQNPSAESVQHARVIGEKYLAARDAMVANGRTYNQIYQQIDDIESDDDSIVDLRKIIVELDKAVLDMYGWSDIQYNRECMKVGDKSRFWVDESTMEELLSRLILLNQELSQNQ